MWEAGRWKADYVVKQEKEKQKSWLPWDVKKYAI